jgi:predicted phage terminase large subunit-like protein
MNYGEYIDQYLTIFENNYTKRTPKEKRIPLNKALEMISDLNNMFEEYFKEQPNKASDISVKRYIPLLDLMLKIDKPHAQDYEKYLHTAYKIASRTSLEHYFIYREWGERKEDKFFAPRFEIMRGYIHYLQEIVTNPNFKQLIVMMPSGYGKTYPEKVSEAWAFGLDPTGTVLALCSNEDVVKGGSSTVRNEMKSEWFGEVFPEMKYSPEDKEYFLKETDGNWKLRDCKLGSSYIASTVKSNVVGVRASQRIHIDDLYPSYIEAMSQKTNEEYYNKFTTVWRKRFVQNKTPKIVISGTLWASGDFISQIVNEVTTQYKFKPHSKYKYTYINEDESIAICRVPALDYQTGRSTCPELRTTLEIEEEMRKIPDYLFQTNFQQKPVDPESMMFSWGRLQTYDKLPRITYEGTYAVIDANRRSGRDFFSMPIFQRDDDENGTDFYYLKDCIYTQTATKDLYEDICRKINEHHITLLIIESNVSSELSQNLTEMLHNYGIYYCDIREKYNTAVKEARIVDQSYNILKRLYFPSQNNVSIQTDIGMFMNELTTYNTNGRNEHDDATDSCAFFTREIVEKFSMNATISIFKRPF